MKTIEEKAKEAWNGYYCPTEEVLYSTFFIDGYMQGAEEALKSPWRSVEDELPEDDSDVVVAYRDRYVGFVKYGVASYDEGCWFSESDDIDGSGIMAWCPIPRYTEKD